MKYYAVIDTNVIVSALLNYESIPGKVLLLVYEGKVTPVFNDEILDEYYQVLARPKFSFGIDVVKSVVDTIRDMGINLTAEKLSVELPDPKDLVFYEVTMEGRKDNDVRLVTGNIKHFPAEAYVVTPRQFIEMIN